MEKEPGVGAKISDELAPAIRPIMPNAGLPHGHPDETGFRVADPSTSNSPYYTPRPTGEKRWKSAEDLIHEARSREAVESKSGEGIEVRSNFFVSAILNASEQRRQRNRQAREQRAKERAQVAGMKAQHLIESYGPDVDGTRISYETTTVDEETGEKKMETHTIPGFVERRDADPNRSTIKETIKTRAIQRKAIRAVKKSRKLATKSPVNKK